MSEARPDPGEPAVEAGGDIDFVSVRIGDVRYAIEAGRVRELVRDPALSRVPRTPPTIAGVVDVRGEVTAAIDGRAVTGVDGGFGGRSPVLVVFARTGREQTTGVLVDAVEGLATRPVEAVATPERGDDGDRELLRAVLEGDVETGVLDPGRVIEAARVGNVTLP